MKKLELPRPKFKKPPVIEVVATVQFSEIDPKDFFLNIDRIWEKIGKEAFPTLDYKNKRHSLSNEATGLKFEFVGDDGAFQFPRLWIESVDRSFVIQLQSDRLSFSWRKLNDVESSDYSSYEIVWKNFSYILDTLSDFAKAISGKSIEINFMELAYINIIPFSDFGGATKIERCFPSVNPQNFPAYVGIVDGVSFAYEAPIEELGAKFKVQGVTVSDPKSGDRLIRLDLVQRGAADFIFDKHSKEIHTWFDEAHLRIVNTFKDITSEYMHTEIWEIKDDKSTKN